MKKEALMKNWSLTAANVNPYKAPELISAKLRGDVYGHPKFPDGTPVITSTILDVVNCGTYIIIETRNTNYKVFAENVDPEYERTYKDAFGGLRCSNLSLRKRNG